MENKPTIEEEIVKMLRTVYDPEIPVKMWISSWFSSRNGTKT